MNATIKQFLLVSSIYLLAPTVNAFDLNDALSSGTEAMTSASEVSGEAQELVGQLQSQLGVTQAQATGGTGALLQLAKNQLGNDSMSTLTSKASGLSSLLRKPAFRHLVNGRRAIGLYSPGYGQRHDPAVCPGYHELPGKSGDWLFVAGATAGSLDARRLKRSPLSRTASTP